MQGYAGLDEFLDAFADAVVGHNARRLCTLVTGVARSGQGCGTEDEDVGPRLTESIRRRADIKVIESTDAEAIVAFPDWRPAPGGPPDPQGRGPQVAKLRKVGDRWRITEFEFRGP